MASVIEFSISAVLFLALLLAMIIYTSIYITQHYKQITMQKLKKEAQDFSQNILFSKTSKFSFIDTTFKRKILIEETTNNSFSGYIIVHVIFDEECEGKAVNNTVRVFDENFNDVNFSFINPIYCYSNFLNQSDIAFYVSLNPLEKKYYFVIYSPDEKIRPKDSYYSSNPINYPYFVIFPEETIDVLSVSKILEVKNSLTIEKLRELTGSYNVYVEIEPL